MSLSNTGGGGRGSDKGEIVGSVILHGKKQYWLKGGQYHYHHGMQAGENTLDAIITNVLLKDMIKNVGFKQPEFVSSYITFMTTPGSHNDAYAGTCHRMFFKNLVAGREPSDCPDNDSHNVDAIDALMIVPPIVLSMLTSDKDARDGAIASAIGSTRNTSQVLPFAYIYGDMLVSVASGRKTVQEAAVDGGRLLGLDVAAAVRRGGADPMTACYITSSFPAMLHFAYKYGDNFERMLLASANAGGENVARGSLLGALGGAFTGFQALPQSLVQGLVAGRVLDSEADNFVELFGPRE